MRLFKMPFGEYEGTPLVDLPNSYVANILNSDTDDIDLKEKLEEAVWYKIQNKLNEQKESLIQQWIHNNVTVNSNVDMKMCCEDYHDVDIFEITNNMKERNMEKGILFFDKDLSVYEDGTYDNPYNLTPEDIIHKLALAYRNNLMTSCPNCGESYLNPSGCELYDELHELKRCVANVRHIANESYRTRLQDKDCIICDYKLSQIIELIDECDKGKTND